MTSFLYRALERLREDRAFSRNRHYLALSSPEGKHALRIHRHLRSLEKDIVTKDVVAKVENEAERVRLTLRGRRVFRTAWLTRDEFRILCSSPDVVKALGDKADR